MISSKRHLATGNEAVLPSVPAAGTFAFLRQRYVEQKSCGYVWFTGYFCGIDQYLTGTSPITCSWMCNVPCHSVFRVHHFCISFLETEVVQHAVNITRTGKNTNLPCINKSSNTKENRSFKHAIINHWPKQNHSLKMYHVCLVKT